MEKFLVYLIPLKKMKLAQISLCYTIHHAPDYNSLISAKNNDVISLKDYGSLPWFCL